MNYPDGGKVDTALEELESGPLPGESRTAAEGSVTFDAGDGARGRIAEVQLLHPVEIEDIE